MDTSDYTQNQMNNLAALLREYRINEGLTQAELGEYSGVHRNTIHRIENGNNISLITLFELFEGLGIKPYELFIDND